MWDKLGAWIADLVKTFKQFFEDLANWFVTLPERFYASLMDSLAAILESIPSPAFIDSLIVNLASLPTELVWLSDIFSINEGILIVLGAYTIRFIIRRIPIIG